MDPQKNKDNPADPYLTLLGYFNSLRELGGSRRIVEDARSARRTERGSSACSDVSSRRSPICRSRTSTLVAEGDLVVAQRDARNPSGDFMGIPATGKSFRSAPLRTSVASPTRV
jgi:hypothetical protein